MTLLYLFFEFFKTGLFAVGGGLATLPFLYDISARRPEWFSKEMLLDMIAVSESTPGPIGVNMATYAGFSAGGPIGAIVATLGLVMPSIIIILLVAKVLEKFKDNKFVNAAFFALRPCVCALVAVAALEVFRVTLFDLSKYGTGNILEIVNLKAVIIFGIVLFMTNKFKAHPIIYIVGAAILGIIFKM